MPEVSLHRRCGGIANQAIKVEATDIGMHGHCSRYQLSAKGNTQLLKFQDGLPATVGINGVTDEALIAVVVDRLRRFQGGPFACRQNAVAITKLEEALHWLGDRTAERRERAVEGTDIP